MMNFWQNFTFLAFSTASNFSKIEVNFKRIYDAGLVVVSANSK